MSVIRYGEHPDVAPCLFSLPGCRGGTVRDSQFTRCTLHCLYLYQHIQYVAHYSRKVFRELRMLITHSQGIGEDGNIAVKITVTMYSFQSFTTSRSQRNVPWKSITTFGVKVARRLHSQGAATTSPTHTCSHTE